jgi:hypothetical protein
VSHTHAQQVGDGRGEAAGRHLARQRLAHEGEVGPDLLVGQLLEVDQLLVDRQVGRRRAGTVRKSAIQERPKACPTTAAATGVGGQPLAVRRQVRGAPVAVPRQRVGAGAGRSALRSSR